MDGHAGDAAADGRRAAGCAARRVGFWPANADGDDIVVLADEARTKPSARASHAAPADGRQREGPATSRCRISSRRASGTPTMSAPSRSRPGMARRRSRSASRRPTTTIRRSWSRRSPTGSRRRSPSTCTSGCARELWGYAPDEALSNAELIAETYRGIRPAPGYPAQPDHTEKETLFELLDAEHADRHEAHRELCDVAGPAVSGSTSPSRGATTSASARSSRTRSRTMPAARAGHGRGREVARPDPQL